MVMFWDTSALLPLAVTEPATQQVQPLAERDASLVVWWGTRVECASALQRREREAALTKTSIRDARRLIAALAKEWSEVAPSEAVRKQAERLLAVHALRAADALQLAAAVVWARNDPSGHAFVCLDERLREAASREGFSVLPTD